MKEIDQILLDLKRRIFKPVYFLSGDEPYFIDQISDYIEDQVLDANEKEFNQFVVYGRETSLSQVLSYTKQYPMLGEKVVVVVKEAQNIRELNKKVSDEDPPDEEDKMPESSSVQEFIQYLTAPQESTILVMCYKYKKIDKRSSIGKALQKHAVFVETKKLFDNQLPDWISNYLQSRQYKINPRSAELLAQSLGADLSKVVKELDKLMINQPAGAEITTETIQQQIGISKEFNVFELNRALGLKDVLKANRIVQYFAANEKENPAPLVISQVFAYFSRIMRYHYLSDKNKFTAASALGVNPFFVDEYVRAAQFYPVAKLRYIFSYIREFDLKSKGLDNYSTSYGELLKELIFKIMH